MQIKKEIRKLLAPLALIMALSSDAPAQGVREGVTTNVISIPAPVPAAAPVRTGAALYLNPIAGLSVEATRNLELNERLYEINQQSYGLIKARVEEGASAPLEQSLLRVEVGRIEAQRAAFESRVAVLLEELKNVLGQLSEEKLQLRDE